MKKALELNRNLTLIFFSVGHSFCPNPHFASRLDTSFAQTINTRLLNVTRVTIRSASVTGASVPQRMLLGSICLWSIIRVTIYDTVVST